MATFNEQEAMAHWLDGVGVAFPAVPKPEPIGNPNLFNVSWQDLEESELGTLTQYPVKLNGVWRQIYVAGWQQFVNGMTILHQEANGEDINLASGTLVMGKTDPEKKNAETAAEIGLFPKEALHEIAFALAVSETNVGGTPMEYLALCALGNISLPLPQLSIADKEYHQVIGTDEAWALVVKHQRVDLS